MSEKLSKAGLQHAWSRIKNYIDTLLGTKQDVLVSGTNIKTVNNSSILGSGNLTIDSGTAFTLALNKDNWTNKTQTVAVSGMTATKKVVVCSALENIDEYEDAEILCTAQAENSLTFTCKTVPSINLGVNLLIL